MVRICLSKNKIIRRLPSFGLANAIAFAILLCMASSTSHAGIIPNDGSVSSGIWYSPSNSFLNAPGAFLNPPVVSGQSGTSSADWSFAENRSVTTVQFEQVGSQLIWNFTVDQSISGAENSEGYAYFSFGFYADTPFQYTASGEYQVGGPGAAYVAVLGLGGPGVDIFGVYKESRSTPNQKFTLTGPDTGDYGNYFIGPASGTGIVDPGGIKTYYGGAAEIYLHSYADDNPSSAIGSFRFVIEPASAPVPEPTSVIAMGVGLSGLAIALRRRRPGTRSQLAT